MDSNSLMNLTEEIETSSVGVSRTGYTDLWNRKPYLNAGTVNIEELYHAQNLVGYQNPIHSISSTTAFHEFLNQFKLLTETLDNLRSQVASLEIHIEQLEQSLSIKVMESEDDYVKPQPTKTMPSYGEAYLRKINRNKVSMPLDVEDLD